MYETEMISDMIVIVDVDTMEDNLQIYFVTLPGTDDQGDIDWRMNKNPIV